MSNPDRRRPGRISAGRSTAALPLTAVAALAIALAVPHPAALATTSEGNGSGDTPCTSGTGPYQRPLEEHLERPVDGVQSVADCEAIRAFQTAHSIEPADGYAGLATHRMAVAVDAQEFPNAEGHCPVRTYRVTCVDLDRQLLWVQRNADVVFPAVPIRTGRDDQETRLGWHSIYWRSKDHVSTIYDNAPMPYAQFFDGGQALHGRPDDLYDGGGSAGCVNLRLSDAEKLWDLLDVDDQLYIWGAKPGTDG